MNCIIMRMIIRFETRYLCVKFYLFDNQNVIKVPQIRVFPTDCPDADFRGQNKQ